MARLNWQGEAFDLTRLVFRPADWADAGAALDRLAARLGLSVGDDDSTPRDGDLWLGCHPITGWHDADPARVAWAGYVESPVALALLRQLAGRPLAASA